MTAAADTVTIRPPTPADVDLLHRLIRELAAYEGAQQSVTGTAAQLAEALFGAEPAAEVLIAEQRDEAGAGRSGEAGSRAAATPAGEPVGFAVFYRTFSTWECRPGMWLEDLYVAERHRRAGIGRALLTELARVTMARGFTRLEWNALDWNEPALGFYARLGAERLSAWELHRLSGDALRGVAEGASPGGRRPRGDVARPTGSTASRREAT